MHLDKHIGEKITVPRFYKRYLNIHFNNKDELTAYEELADVIKAKLEVCGYLCIITSGKMTAKEALIHYKGCDVSEKLFSSGKPFIDPKSMRVQTSEAHSAKIFIEFITLIV